MTPNENQLTDFYNEVIIPVRDERLKALKIYCQENRDQLSKDLINGITEVMKKATTMQKQETKGKAAYIILSFLRSYIYADLMPDFCRIDVYDENNYDDEQECFVYVSCPWAKEHILGFDKSIREEVKKSALKLPEYQMEALVFAEAFKFAEDLRYLLRYSIPEIEKLEGVFIK